MANLFLLAIDRLLWENDENPLEDPLSGMGSPFGNGMNGRSNPVGCTKSPGFWENISDIQVDLVSWLKHVEASHVFLITKS